jgi:hypothetical protein
MLQGLDEHEIKGKLYLIEPAEIDVIPENLTIFLSRQTMILSWISDDHQRAANRLLATVKKDGERNHAQG